MQSLKLVGENSGPGPTRELCLRMFEQVQHGASLAEAVQRERKHLPPYFVHLVSAGELGGQLDVVFRDLANYFEDRLAMRRSIISSIWYPMTIAVVAWFFLSFSLRLVSQLNPMSTERFNFGAFAMDYLQFQAYAMLVFGALVLLCLVLNRIGIFQWIWGAITNYVWPLRPVTRRFALARFFRSLALLIGSGLNIRQCIRSAAAVTANPYIQRDLLRAEPMVAEGATLVQAFSGSRSLTPMAREMLRVGEESGNLEASLQKVSEYHLAEATEAVKRAAVVLGVVVFLMVGISVGYCIIMFYQNLYGNMLGDL